MSTSRSRPPTRPSMSRSASRAPRMPEYDLLTSEGAELLHEFIHPHPDAAHELEETLVDVAPEDVGDEDQAERDAIEAERAERAQLPWWRRPAAWWFLSIVPLGMVAFTVTIAPKLEIFTELVCAAQHGIPRDSENEEHASSDTSCAKDPRVQATVAVLMTTMTTIAGVLGCLTTAWWGSLSDRKGRLFVKRANCISLIYQDILFIAVFLFPSRIPGGYWALLTGPVVDGFLGGRMASSAAIHAYVADVSEPAARSRVFSQYMGLVFIGMAVGPTLGALISRYGKTIYAFYFAAGLHVIYVLMMWLVIPESLTPTQMRVFARRHAADTIAAKQRKGFVARLGRLFGFLTPLAVFLPGENDRTMVRTKGKSKGGRTDYSLTLLASAFALETLILGSAQITPQFALGSYGWGAEKLGYWISVIGVSRALFLAAVLPAILTVLNRRAKKQPIALHRTDSEPLISTPSHSAEHVRSPSTNKSPAAGRKHEVHTPVVELLVARLSLVAAAISGAMLMINPPEWVFILGTNLAACAAGFHPTMQSLAMELYRARVGPTAETGRLFGALSVLQSLGSAIIGPALYGFIYIRTVRSYPAMIFVCNFAIGVGTLVILAFLRLPEGLGDEPREPLDAEEGEEDEVEGHGREETLVPEIVIDDEQQRALAGRGRKGSVSATAATA